MPINITMPALSPTMEEGNLAKWLVKEGDTIAPGDVIAEIETDKATMEVEAVDEGTVAKIIVPAGTEGVKVNALIAILAAEGEDVKAAASGGDAKAEAPKVDAKAVDAPKEAEKPVADKAPAASTPAPVAKDGNRVFSSPLARRLAKEAGLDISAVSGSGPHGRVVKSDVEKAVASGGAKAAAAPAAASAAPAAAPKGMSEEAVLKLFEQGSYELVPHDGMRKTIAKRLVESKQTIPHFYVSVDVELDALLALRAQLNDAAPKKDDKPAYKLSVNDMVIKAMALALRDVPDANVSWTDTNMVKHKHADVGVAVSIPGGLITPIIAGANAKGVAAISSEMKDRAERARNGKLQPHEYQGGTASLSNMGMFGIKQFEAVINPPQAMIMAIGAGEKRPYVVNNALTVATVMSVTGSFDHRAIDGADGAQLMAAFKRIVEKPLTLLA
jgi:pyruvate dehydrogenase E2 component (dihydrolipoamide acetyltransferase)